MLVGYPCGHFIRVVVHHNSVRTFHIRVVVLARNVPTMQRDNVDVRILHKTKWSAFVASLRVKPGFDSAGLHSVSRSAVLMHHRAVQKTVQ